MQDGDADKASGLTTGLLDNVQGVASDATAASANVFLRQSNEEQKDELPVEGKEE